jgi:transitional endoplasmic reticulum ATPase
MSAAPEPSDISALRAAVVISPDNVPLRLLLAEALHKYNFFPAAIEEYRECLRCEPRNAQLKFGLARAFHSDGKNAEAVVLLEDLLATGQGPAAAHLLFARLLCERAELQKAAEHARRARELDPAAVDADLDARLEPFMSRPASKGGVDDEVDDQGRVRARVDDIPGEAQADIERPKVNFADVGGMELVKEQIRMKIIHPVAHAELFKAYGKKIGGGLLLYGPPGCGKTHLARATAGEVRASFLSIGLHDVLDMYIGQSEKRLHEIFQQARRHRPSVLFIDEVDALGANRANFRQNAGRNLINQFLAEMDGLEASNDGLLVLAATNAPWHLDPAFRRPGRFDHLVFVPPPDAPARTEILRVLLRGKPAEAVDFAKVAEQAEGFSGADLKGLIDQAVETKLTAAMKTGRIEPLTTKELLTACKRTKPTTLEWFSTAKNYAMYANQGGQYDDVLNYLKNHR